MNELKLELRLRAKCSELAQLGYDGSIDYKREGLLTLMLPSLWAFWVVSAHLLSLRSDFWLLTTVLNLRLLTSGSRSLYSISFSVDTWAVFSFFILFVFNLNY